MAAFVFIREVQRGLGSAVEATAMHRPGEHERKHLPFLLTSTRC